MVRRAHAVQPLAAIQNEYSMAYRDHETQILPLCANMALVQLLLDWSVRKGATAAQLSLAWLRAQQPWIVPIPSSTRLSHLLENLGTEEVAFSKDEPKELTGVMPPGSRPGLPSCTTCSGTPRCPVPGRSVRVSRIGTARPN